MVAIYNMPDQYNGDSFGEIIFNFYVNDTNSTNNMDYADPKIQFKNKKDLNTVVSTLTIGSGLQWVDRTNGKFKIATSDPIDWGAGTYLYDLQVTHNDASPAKIKTYLKGRVRVLSEITT